MSPYREQPTDNTITARDLKMLAPSSKLSATIRAFSWRLLAPSTVVAGAAGDHLDATI
jgi:hypothetical protein